MLEFKDGYELFQGDCLEVMDKLIAGGVKVDKNIILSERIMHKTIITISKINRCNDCNHMYEKMDSREYACDYTKTYKKIRDIYIIPNWCGLKDFEVKNEL